MTLRADDWTRVKAVFGVACTLPANARPAYVAEACGEDAALRSEVERLLSSHAAAGSFLEGPATLGAHGTPVTAPLEGQCVGSCRIDARIGAGGMGEVYRALDVRLNRPVAIKFLSPEFATESARRRFQHEATMASALNHPHVLTVHEAGDFGSSAESVGSLRLR